MRALMNQLLAEVTEVWVDSGFNGDIYHYTWKDAKRVEALLQAALQRTA